MVTGIALVTAACGGHSWPSTTPAKADPAFAARQRPITTIDLLPVDVEAWTQPGVKMSAEELRITAEVGFLGAASDQLLSRGYIVGNAIGWDGAFVRPDGETAVALAPNALLATVESLSAYGLAVQQSRGLPVPYLPVRLGDQTGADATMYIGGWTYRGKDTSSADKVLKGVLIGIAIVGVIVVLAVIAKGGGDGLGKAAGGVARGAANAAVSVARVAARVALEAGNATIHIGKGLAQVSADVLDTTFRIADAWGRSPGGTHIQVFGPTSPRPPSWSERPEAPQKGHSRTYLELTLVDNRTGLVLWHARQQFPTHAGTDQKAHKIIATLMQSLPVAGLDPMAEYRQ